MLGLKIGDSHLMYKEQKTIKYKLINKNLEIVGIL